MAEELQYNCATFDSKVNKSYCGKQQHKSMLAEQFQLEYRWEMKQTLSNIPQNEEIC